MSSLSSCVVRNFWRVSLGIHNETRDIPPLVPKGPYVIPRNGTILLCRRLFQIPSSRWNICKAIQMRSLGRKEIGTLADLSFVFPCSVNLIRSAFTAT